MNKIIVAVFNNETQAAQSLVKLQHLHSNGDITLYASAVFAKDAEGKVSVRQVADQGPVGTAIGMIVGGLVGALAGPVGVAAGAALGGLSGSFSDLYESGVDARFADEVAAVLSPNKVALVVDLEEEWKAPVDVALEGAEIFRNSRAQIEEAQWESDLAADRAEAAALEAALAEAEAETKAQIQQELESVKQRIAEKKAQWESKIEKVKAETEHKIQHAQQQLKNASEEKKAAIQARIDNAKADLNTRQEKLKAASALIKDALSH